MSKNTGFRNARRESFTMICNDFINDPSVTLQAKHLLTIFISNKEDWKIQMPEIIKRSKNGRDAHYNCLSELIENGYVARIVARDKATNLYVEQTYLFSDSKDDVKNAIETYQKETKELYNLEVFYRIKKEKKTKSESLNKSINKKITPLPESQDTDNRPLPESQDTDNADMESQYINNTKLDNTKLDNTKELKDEEEEIYNKVKKNIFLQSLLIELNEKKLTKQTILNILRECINQRLREFSPEDIKKQLEFMAEENNNGKHFGQFHTYFVNGLRDRTEQRRLTDNINLGKELEQQQREKRDTSFYYNWLEEDGRNIYIT